MPINISNYVDITSGVGAASNVATRDLGALIITNNALCPTGTIKSFHTAVDVGDYFGTDSEEYARALFYFGWVSKSITAPETLSFWFWNDHTATASLIFGSAPIDTLTAFNAISAGQLNLTLGTFTHTLTGIDLSAAGSLAAVAADVQAAIRAYSAGGAAWTGASVTYNSTSGSFDLVSGATGADTVSVAVAASNDLGGPLGWLNADTIFSNGTAAQTITANLDILAATSNDFGSFCYTADLAVTVDNLILAAEWNKALSPNMQYMLSIVVTPSNASTWSADFIDIGGVTLTLQSPVDDEYPEMVPMMIMGATDYNRVNSVQNYMFQVFDLTASVTTDALQATYDALRINYYGQTQTAGQLIEFYQRGVMMGLPVDPSDQGVYANEVWLKDALGAALMNLLLASTQVPANNTGRAMVLSALQAIINQGVTNGSISVGKTLNTTQQLYISQLTGNPIAWQQVQNNGYWVNVVIQSYVEDSVTQYKAVYTLVYSKNDTIRLIQGSDVLI